MASPPIPSNIPQILLLIPPTLEPNTAPTETPKVHKKPYCTSAKLKLPIRSPFHIHSVEEEERTTAVNDSFIEVFQKCVLSAPVPKEFKKQFPVDLWRNILDYIDAPSDLLSLCRTSSSLHLLAIPYLYRKITIRSPLYHGEYQSSRRKLIPLDLLLQPPVPVISRIEDESETEAIARSGSKRKRISQRGDEARERGEKHIRLSSRGDGSFSSAAIQLPKREFLRYVRDLKVEKWEGLHRSLLLPGLVSSGQPGEKQKVWQDRTYGPEGIRDLSWARKGAQLPTPLSKDLAGLLEGLTMLESFCYNPQRYHSLYAKTTPNRFVQPVQANQPNQHIETNSHKARVSGIKPAVFDVLKALPELKSLTINFQDWDPLNPKNTRPYTFITRTNAYEATSAGLVGFKNLEELVILGVSASRRFSEIERVVRDCVFSTNSRRTLKRLEVRFEERWHRYLQERNQINPSQDLWDWVVFLWSEFFGKSESFRCAHGLDGVDISVLLEFGPIRWYWECPKLAGLICRSENLTALDLQGVHEKQILGAIKRLAELGTPCLQVFAVECRLIELNILLKRFCGLKELYVFEPEAEDDGFIGANQLQSNCADASPLSSGAFRQGPVDIKGTHWVLDTICKCHLRTLEVLVIQEIICPPHPSYTSATINSISGWKERGMNLRELAIRVWGPWEEIGNFLTAFERLKALHLFNHHRCGSGISVRGLPIYKPIVDKGPITYCRNFYNAETTAVRIANLWGRDLICAKKTMRPVTLEEDRWIGIGHCVRPWKWKINDAAKYVSWENWESQLWFKFVDGADSKARVWEEGGRMWRVLRQGGILTHYNNDKEGCAIDDGCCIGCSNDMTNDRVNSFFM